MKPNLYKPIFAILVTLAFLSATSPAFAVDKNWNNPGTGDWFLPSNWTPGITAPGPGDNAQIDNGGTAQILSAGATAFQVFLGLTPTTGDGNLDIAGPGTLVAGGNIIVAYTGGTATFNITSGGTASNGFDAIIGFAAGTNGTATVDGTGSKWTSATHFYVGYSGTGTLNITGGGQVLTTRGFLGFTAAGDGTVIVDGTGSLFHNSDNLYIGGDTGGPQGTGLLRIENGGQVSSDNTFVWNTGTIEIGVNPILLNLTLNYVGGTLRTIANTTFTNDVIVHGAGIIVDSKGFTSTLSGIYSDIGGLTKIGTGSIFLTNTNTYTGDTNVNAGSLFIDGSIASVNTYVKPGALLGGTGTIIGSVLNDGTVSPGDGPGMAATLTINHNYTQNSDGNFIAELGGLADGVESDLLHVGASASIAGNVQLIRLDSFSPSPGDEVTIITAFVGRTGEFETVDEIGWGLIHPVPQYDRPHEVYVVFELTPFSTIGGTRNQICVEENLDAAATLSSSAAIDLVTFVGNILPPDLPEAFDLLAPEELASIYEISFSHAFTQGMNLQRRMSDIRVMANGYCEPEVVTQEYSGGKGATDGKTVLNEKNAVAAVESCPDKRWGVFATGSGEFVDVGDEDLNAPEYDFVTGSFVTGVDYRVNSHIAVGIDGGYYHSNANLINAGTLDVDSGQVGLYATVFSGGFYFDAAANAGWNTYDYRRTALGGVEDGNTEGAEFSGLVGGGYDWKLKGCWTIGPFATFQYNYLEIDSFSETGTSVASLDYPDQNQEQERSTLGLKVAYESKRGNTILRPELRVAWQHEFEDTDYAIDWSFGNIDNHICSVFGPRTGEDSLLVDAGFALVMGRCHNVSAYVYYNGNLARENYDRQGASGGVRVSF